MAAVSRVVELLQRRQALADAVERGDVARAAVVGGESLDEDEGDAAVLQRVEDEALAARQDRVVDRVLMDRLQYAGPRAGDLVKARDRVSREVMAAARDLAEVTAELERAQAHGAGLQVANRILWHTQAHGGARPGRRPRDADPVVEAHRRKRAMLRHALAQLALHAEVDTSAHDGVAAVLVDDGI